MKEAQPSRVRNVALVAHQGSGKTTLTESMLHRMGVLTRMGSIEDGNTASDYRADEIDRQMSISTTLVVGEHNGVKINLIDTPGFTDFMGEVKTSVRVADVVGVLIQAASGVEVGTELVWGFADELSLPRFLFINQLDRENVDFDSVVGTLEESYGSAIPIQFPVNPGSEQFNQIVDLLSMKVVTWNPDGGIKSKSDIPGGIIDKANEAKQKLIDAIAESDDDLMELYFENDELTEDQLMTGLRNGIRNGMLYPILCGAASKEVGTSLLLDFLVNVAPSPEDMPPSIAKTESSDDDTELKCDPEGDLGAIVFKTISDKHVGDLAFFRVFSGTLSSGADVRNTSRSQVEKIGQIFTVSGNKRKNVDAVAAGDMGALVKLKNTHTGDTLSTSKAELILEGIDFPTPVIRTAVVAKTQGDEEKISNGLHILAEEDPSFHFDYDPELAQLIVSGQGELQLIILLERLKERFGVEVEQEEPRIPYRETIKGSSETQGKHKKQSGGRGQYGDCWLRIEKQPRGGDFEFVNAIVGGVIPGKFVPAVEKGVIGAMADGVVAGFPVVDVKVTCYDGSHHTVDSSENAFKMAGSKGFRAGFAKAKPVILEPIYNVEVRVPEEYMGDVMGDISSRRGKIMGMDAEGRFQVIKAQVPLAELYKYSSILRSLTGGRGLHTRELSHYEDVPIEIQAKLIKVYEEKRAEGTS